MGATPERGAHGGGGELVVEGGQAAALAGRHPPRRRPLPQFRRPPTSALTAGVPAAVSGGGVEAGPGRGAGGGRNGGPGRGAGVVGAERGSRGWPPPPTWGKPGSTRYSTHPGVFVQ